MSRCDNRGFPIKNGYEKVVVFSYSFLRKYEELKGLKIEEIREVYHLKRMRKSDD